MKSIISGTIVLCLLAPLTAEILNGSTRLSELASVGVLASVLLPYMFVILLLAYFSQTAISRSSVFFLLPIPGIIIEGLITKSFFNTTFSDLSVLGGVGVWGGVQWPWTLSLLVSHLFVSLLIPLTLAVILMKVVKVKKMLAVLSAIVLLVYVGWMGVVGVHTFPQYWIKIITLVGICAFLITLSRTVILSETKSQSIGTFAFFVVGLLLPVSNWLTSFFIASKGAWVIIFCQGIFVISCLYFLRTQWFNESATWYKKLAFIAGYYLPFAIGLSVVGVKREIMDYKIVGISLLVLISIFFYRHCYFRNFLHSENKEVRIG